MAFFCVVAFVVVCETFGVAMIAGGVVMSEFAVGMSTCRVSMSACGVGMITWRRGMSGCGGANERAGCFLTMIGSFVASFGSSER